MLALVVWLATAPASASAPTAPVTAPAASAEHAASISVRELSADTEYVDDKSGDAGVLFELKGVSLKNLANKKVTWTLFVKRKLAPWTSARNFPFAVTRVKGADHVEKLISAPLLHMTLASDGFLPGEHEAALVATVDGKTELVRVEAPFVLKAGVFRPLVKR